MKHLNPIYLKDKVFFIMFSGCVLGFFNLLSILYVFFTAYLNGTKTTNVKINTIGEANLELFLLLTLLSFFVICLIYGTKRILTEKVTNESA